MNLKDEERTPDLEGKAGMQQRGVPMPGRTEGRVPQKQPSNVARDRLAPGRRADLQFWG